MPLKCAGRCSICRHLKAGPQLIEGAVAEWTFNDAKRYAAQFDYTFTEPTWYLHRKNIRLAKARQAETPPEAETVREIQHATNTELLEAVRDFAMDEVKRGRVGALKDGLRAVQILEARKGRDDAKDFLSILTTGHSPRIQVMDDLPDEDDETEP